MMKLQRTRAEHIAWAKARALEETHAHLVIASFTSDLTKHAETRVVAGDVGSTLTALLVGVPPAERLAAVRAAIERFPE